MVDDLAGLLVEPRAELGERFELAELRVGQLEVARHAPVGRPLRLAADARDRLADVDGGRTPSSKRVGDR